MPVPTQAVRLQTSTSHLCGDEQKCLGGRFSSVYVGFPSFPLCLVPGCLQEERRGAAPPPSFACWRMATDPALLHLRREESLKVSDAALQMSADQGKGVGDIGSPAICVKRIESLGPQKGDSLCDLAGHTCLPFREELRGVRDTTCFPCSCHQAVPRDRFKP